MSDYKKAGLFSAVALSALLSFNAVADDASLTNIDVLDAVPTKIMYDNTTAEVDQFAREKSKGTQLVVVYSDHEQVIASAALGVYEVKDRPDVVVKGLVRAHASKVGGLPKDGDLVCDVLSKEKIGNTPIDIVAVYNNGALFSLGCHADSRVYVDVEKHLLEGSKKLGGSASASTVSLTPSLGLDTPN